MNNDDYMTIWLTRQDAELARDALDFWCAELDTAYGGSNAHKAASRYVCRRAKELRARLQAIVEGLALRGTEDVAPTERKQHGIAGDAK